MRLSLSLETEETRQVEQALDSYNRRWIVIMLAITLTPLALYVSKEFFDVFPPRVKSLEILMFGIIFSGFYYVFVKLPQETLTLTLTFPEIETDLILYQDIDRSRHQKVVITRDEIWRQDYRESTTFGAHPQKERRVAKRDVTRIEKKHGFGGTHFNLSYRTSQGEKRFSLRAERDDNLETALYTNVKLAEVPV